MILNAAYLSWVVLASAIRILTIFVSVIHQPAHEANVEGAKRVDISLGRLAPYYVGNSLPKLFFLFFCDAEVTVPSVFEVSTFVSHFLCCEVAAVKLATETFKGLVDFGPVMHILFAFIGWREGLSPHPKLFDF